MDASSTDYDSRLIGAVHDLLMAGKARWQIAAHLAEHAKDASQRQPSVAAIDAAVAACVDNWVSDAAADQNIIHAYHLALRKHLINRSIAADDYQTAARIAQDLAKLQDQYTTTNASAKRQPGRNRRIAKLKQSSAGSLRLIASND